MNASVKAQLRATAEKARDWTRRRDAAIVDAYTRGATFRDIATEVGFSHTGVRRVVERAKGEVEA